VPALLDSKRLKTLLLVVMRNHTTGSAWPVTNNPLARYNDPTLPDCNLKIPLWKLVRASAAAPVYFDPKRSRWEASVTFLSTGRLRLTTIRL